MIGLRSLVVTASSALIIGACAAAGALRAEALAALDVATCVALGALAALAVAFVTLGGLSRTSRVALDLRRLALVFAPADPRRAEKWRPRELPAPLVRALLAAMFVAAGVAAIGQHGVDRLRALGDGGPPSGRCKDQSAPLVAEPAPDDHEDPPPPPVDLAGCTLVRRAFALGYTKSLGSCAPRQAVAAKPAAPSRPVVEPCERRHIDEPFFHFAWRRWMELGRAIADIAPIAATRHQAHEVSTMLVELDPLVASSSHALGATPHAAHHVWITLPAPTQEEHPWLAPPAHRRCEERFSGAALWPRWAAGQEAELVEHAFAQLLFAARFGTTTACANYRFHWGAPADVCERLERSPISFLRAHGAWDEVAAVLDRRKRQLELRALAQRLGRPMPPEPPPASAAVSLVCIAIGDKPARARLGGTSVAVGGAPIGLRTLRRGPIELGGAGPLELLAELAELLAGAAGPSEPPGPASVVVAPDALAGVDLPLAQLEVLESAAPFAGTRWPLSRDDLAEIYPYQRFLFPFIDEFRRRYFAQRGRL